MIRSLCISMNVCKPSYRSWFEQSLATVTSVIQRLSNLKKTVLTFPPELIKQVAERIFLMELSFEPFEKNMQQGAIIKVLYEPVNGISDIQGIDFWKSFSSP